MSADGSVAVLTTLIALAALVDSPYQPPGRSERGIDELVASMDAPEGTSTRGQTTPLLVRLLDNGTYRIVGGHRRRRALERRGSTHALCIVRVMTDAEERELALVDNIQRADLSALEEADELGRMRDELGYSPERIAGRIGKSTAHVNSRLALLRLAPACREALADGRILLGAATGRLSLSTIGEAEQLDALKEMLAPWRQGEISLTEVRRLVQKYHLRLAPSGIPLDDATLVPAAGSCAKCPKRSGAQLQLLGEAEPDERCTDAACFKTKQDAVWARAKTTAKAEGVRLIEGAEAKKLYPYSGENLDHKQRDKLIDLDSRYEHDPVPGWSEDDDEDEDEEEENGSEERKEPRTWAEALGEAVKPEALVKTDYGTVRRLITAEQAEKAMKAAGLSVPSREPSPAGGGAQRPDAPPAPKNQTWEVERKGRERMIENALDAIVEHAEGATAIRVNHMRHLVALLIRAAPEDRLEDVCRRRTLVKDEEQPWDVDAGWKALLDLAAKASLGELLGLAIEIAILSDEYFPPAASQTDTAFHIAARFADVDIEKLTKAAEKKVKAELEAERKGKPEKAKKTSKKTSPKSPLTESEEAALEADVEAMLDKKEAPAAPAFAVGDRVRIIGGDHKGREGVIEKRPKLFPACAIVRIERRGKERAHKVPMIELKNLEPVEKTDPKPEIVREMIGELAVVCPRCKAAAGVACTKEGGGTHVQRAKLAADQVNGEPVDAAKAYATAARERVWNACEGGKTRAQIEELTGLPKAVVEKETDALFLKGRLAKGKGDVYTRVGSRPAEDLSAVMRRSEEYFAEVADKANEPAQASDDRPTCRVCKCSGTCDLFAGRTCTLVEGLCSLCNEIADAAQEAIERAPLRLADIIQVVDTAIDLEIDNERILTAIDDRIAHPVEGKGELRRMKGDVIAWKAPLKLNQNSSAIETEILLDLAGGSCNAAMLCTSLKRLHEP